LAGNADAADFGESFKARSDIHAVAVDIVGIGYDVAEMDADAEPHAPRLGLTAIALRHFALDFRRAFDRRYDA
jgi:hypothetical protein